MFNFLEGKVFDFSEGSISLETLTLEGAFLLLLRGLPLSHFASEGEELIFSEILTLEGVFPLLLRDLPLSHFASERV